MATKNYTLFLSSADKISGTNNNAKFNVNWDLFLPRDYDTFQVTFNFNITAGYYKDTGNTTVYSHAKVVLDTVGRSFSYDTGTYGPSLILGYANREPSSNTANSTCGFNSFFAYNSPKTINRPTESQIKVKIYNVKSSLLLVDTDSSGVATADMTPLVITLSFIPVGVNIKPDNFPYVNNQ